MSQEYTTTTKRPRRTRVPRNRPVLVTGNESSNGALSAVAEASTPTTEDLTLDTPEAATPVPVEAVPAKRTSRLPGFFSKVNRSEQEEDNTPSKEEVVEARLARAKKGAKDKNVAETKAETKATAKPATKPQAQTKPKLFKTRHFIGLMAYLLVAQILLPFERTWSISLHMEKVLFTIPGINLPVQTSFLLNIITLIGLLYALVALDFLPSGKQFAAEQAKYNKTGSKNGTSNTQGQQNPRQIPPAVRPGVQGEDDDLYKSYRMNQRKKK
jgi:hypothetical protein